MDNPAPIRYNGPSMKIQLEHAHLKTLFHTLVSLCAARKVPAWLVGGTVRDLVMGDVPHDLDLAVAADGVALARRVADMVGGAFVVLDHERGAGRVVWVPGGEAADEQGEVPRTRPEPADERLVVDLVRLRGDTIEEDLVLRDFTINAMALPLDVRLVETIQSGAPPITTALIDPCGGLRDSVARVLRPCRPTSVRDDPLRILRAVRLAAALDLHISPELDSALRKNARLVGQVAAERVREELCKLLAEPWATPWLRYLDDIGVLTRLFPELEAARNCDQPLVHFLPVLAHLLETVAALEWLIAKIHAAAGAGVGEGAGHSVPPPVLPDAALPAAVRTHPDLPCPFTPLQVEKLHARFTAVVRSDHPRVALLKLAALLHDNAKPQTKQPKPEGGVSFYGHQEIGADIAHVIAHRLRLSREEARYVSLVVRHHMRPYQLRSDEQVTPRAIARFFRDTEGAGPDILVHELADHLASRGPNLDPTVWSAHLQWVREMLDTLWSTPEKPPPPLLNGHDLMAALGIEPGKRVGELLRELRDAQMAGEVRTREEAVELARRMLVSRDEDEGVENTI